MQSEHIVTVTTAAATYDLVTLDVVKDELSIGNNSKDVTLKRYITSASAMAAQYCNRVFPAETITEQFWAARDRWPRIINGTIAALQLQRYPIQSVTSVTENAVVLVQDTDFKIDPANGQLIRLDINGYPKPWPSYPIVVVYVGGFATIPVDVQDAVIRMVTSRWASKGRDKNLRQENVPGVIERTWWISTGSDSGNMSPDISDILDNYRVPVLAA
jgi:uncharacterized phiE125 gp8 family phage protein